MQEPAFTLRRDQNGYRPVFPLGNILGQCPCDCTFCGVKTTAKVTLDEAVEHFDELFLFYQASIDGPYHPVIYNRGNVTNPKEFPRQLLDYVLGKFSIDRRVTYISLNSRERYITPEVLTYLADKHLPYRVHFILGVESFSRRATSILGKNTKGELSRAVHKLKKFHDDCAQKEITERSYDFGLDVNLVFLPELYIDEGDTRSENFPKIKVGLEHDLVRLLHLIKAGIPVEINVHPYYRVESLPYDDADIDVLVRLLPGSQDLVLEHNEVAGTYQTHLFVGIEGPGYSTEYLKAQINKWRSYIDRFNQGCRDRI